MRRPTVAGREDVLLHDAPTARCPAYCLATAGQARLCRSFADQATARAAISTSNGRYTGKTQRRVASLPCPDWHVSARYSHCCGRGSGRMAVAILCRRGAMRLAAALLQPGAVPAAIRTDHAGGED